MTLIEELEKNAEIELQKLGVAENLGWCLSGLTALSAHMKWENWLLSILVFFSSYYIVTYPYRKKENDATDAYHRVAGIGKYYRAQKNTDQE